MHWWYLVWKDFEVKVIFLKLLLLKMVPALAALISGNNRSYKSDLYLV